MEEKNRINDRITEEVTGGAAGNVVQPEEWPVSPYEIDPSRCDPCGDCIQVCPVNAITLRDFKPVIFGHCIECGSCVSVCKSNAIRKNV